MSVRNLLAASAFIVSASTSFASPVRLSLAWTASTGTFLETPSTLVDLAGDGSRQVVTAGREELIALNSNGSPRWRWHTPARFMTYPAAYERKGKPALIFVSDNGGQLTCVDGSGSVVWKRNFKAGSSWSSAVVCDLNHDGHRQVIQSDDSGIVHAFDALSGRPIWDSPVTGSPASPAVGIVSDADHDQIAVSTNSGLLYLLDYKGKALWKRKVSASCDTWQTSAPVIFTASDGKSRIVVGASDGRISCFDGAGKPLWVKKTKGYIASSISVGDMDHRGRADVFAISGTGMIYRLDEGGKELWHIDMQGRTIGAGALIDLKNSGSLDYVISTQSGHLMAFNRDAGLDFDYQFSNRTINMTPTFGHVVPSATGLNMVITGGESGKIFCFNTSTPLNLPASARCWTAYRGDAAKSGSWNSLLDASSPIVKRPASPVTSQWMKAQVAGSGMRLTGSVSRLAIGDPCVFKVEAPSRFVPPLHASAICVLPDGAKQAVMTPLYGLDGEVKLPVDLLQPGEYGLHYSLNDDTGKFICEGSSGFRISAPFVVDRAIVQQALTALTEVGSKCAPTLPLTSKALRSLAIKLAQQATEVDPLQRAGLSAQSPVVQQTIDLVAAARRSFRIASASLAASSVGRGTSVLAFQSSQWQSGEIARQTPNRAEAALAIARRVTPERHDGVSIKLFNITDRELQLRIVPDAIPNGPTISLLRSVAVPTKQGGMAWDAFTPLDDTSTITIPALETREIWVDAAFKGVSPGDYNLKLHCLALNGAGVLEGPHNALDIAAPQTQVTVSYHVIPYMPSPPGSFRLTCWANYGPGDIADLLDHGNTVFTVPYGDVVYSPTGDLIGFDYTKLDILLDQMRGQDVVLLISGKPAIKAPEGSEQYQKELKICMNDLTLHLDRVGIDQKHFALYPYDEPGGNGWQSVNGLVDFASRVKSVSPSVQIYVDGGADLDMIKKMAPFVDVWCPPIGMPAEQSPEMDLLRNAAKTLWTYECGYGYTSAMDANLKDTNIVAEYGISALFALRWKAEGIGFWCYNIGADPWQRQSNDYQLVYPGKNHPVTSRRWEAVRQSMEDARTLIALKALEKTTSSIAVREKIHALIFEALPLLGDRSHKEVLAGLGRSAFSYSMNDATLASFRKQMFDCVEAACK